MLLQCTHKHALVAIITFKVIGFLFLLLNQARAGLRPARAWFLKIDPVRIVGMRACVRVCVCPRPRLSITSGVMWRDIDLI